MPTNAEIEGFWIDAWSDLHEITKDRWDVRCLLPDGEVVDLEQCKGWLQDSAYSGYIPAVTPGWVLGRPGVVASRVPAPSTQPNAQQNQK
jgi:hypothetical protein